MPDVNQSQFRYSCEALLITDDVDPQSFRFKACQNQSVLELHSAIKVAFWLLPRCYDVNLESQYLDLILVQPIAEFLELSIDINFSLGFQILCIDQAANSL